MAAPLSPEQLAETARNLWVLSFPLFTFINPFQGWPPRCSHWLHVVGLSQYFVCMKRCQPLRKWCYSTISWSPLGKRLSIFGWESSHWLQSYGLWCVYLFSSNFFDDVSKANILTQESVSLSVGLHCDHRLWVIRFVWAFIFIFWSNIGCLETSISREMERGGLQSLYTLSWSPKDRNFIRHWRCVGWARLYSISVSKFLSQSSDFYYAVVRYLFTEFDCRSGWGMSVGRRARS